MSKVPVEHTISGVRSYVSETMLNHPSMGKYLRPVRTTKPVIVFDAPKDPIKPVDTPEELSETRKEKK